MAIAQVDLVGNSGRPVVTPQATEQLASAFRDGFITADEIMERVSERTKAKQELELVTAQQGIADATNPDLIQAKRNQQLAAGAQAGSALTLNPLAEQAKTAELKAAIFDAQAKPGGFSLMQEALSKAGYPVSVDVNTGLTDANKNEIVKRFSALQTYTLKRADAEDRVKNTETKFFPTEQKAADGGTVKGQLQKLFRNGQEVTSDEFKNWATEAEALKRTPFSTWYALQSTKPGQVVTPAPVAPLIQPRAATPTPMIQPTAAITPQIGGTAPGIGIVTSIEAAPTPVVVRPTEGQQRALLAVPRFQEANTALQNLQARGYDPTSWRSWIDSYLPQIAKSGNRKELETAMSAWSQGLLRLESGAAITPKEEGWYVSTFFPAVGDPPNVVLQKENLRKNVEAMVDEVGVAGEIPEDIKLRVRALRNTLPGGTVTTTAAPALPAMPSAAPVFTLTEASKQPSGTIFKDAAGNWRRKL